MRIGIDFDNTLVSYDRAFALVGMEEGLLPADFVGGKEAVKYWLYRERPDGYLWERLQGLVYGRRIERAELFDGVGEFFRLSRDRDDCRVFIISHKSMLAHHDPLQTNLRTSALRWMKQQGFFDQAGFGLDPGQVFFEETREGKIRRIAELACQIFVDDLPEVLEDAEMPMACRKILFRAERAGPFERVANWTEICDAVFRRS
jgi:hypothetical protein